MSEYQFAQKSALKLKGVSDGEGIKKKKKKSKSKNKIAESSIDPTCSTSAALDEINKEASASKVDDEQYYRNKTKSEIDFLKRKEASNADRIRKKASVSHKERVEKFNEYLNNLSEHYEPAKVSWTK